MQTEMLTAAEDLDFERAANLRDRISQMQDSIGEPLSEATSSAKSSARKGKGRGRKKGRGAKVPRPKKQS